jgi:hypothetical protein
VGLTNEQVDDQDCDHASQGNMKSRADMCEVFRVRECFISGHTPCKPRAGIVCPDDDEEVQAHHDEGTEDTTTNYRARHVHPPIHIWLRRYHNKEARLEREQAKYLENRRGTCACGLTSHVVLPIPRGPEQQQRSEPARDAAEDHGPDHDARSLPGRVPHLLDQVHHAISPVQTVHGRVEGHDEHPTFAGVAGVVDEQCEDELGIVLWCCHDTKHDCPC